MCRSVFDSYTFLRTRVSHHFNRPFQKGQNALDDLLKMVAKTHAILTQADDAARMERVKQVFSDCNALIAVLAMFHGEWGESVSLNT